MIDWLLEMQPPGNSCQGCGRIFTPNPRNLSDDKVCSGLCRCYSLEPGMRERVQRLARNGARYRLKDLKGKPRRRK